MSRAKLAKQSYTKSKLVTSLQNNPKKKINKNHLMLDYYILEYLSI